jgi:concanavalin A-like lectin/glucanase superfamily protein
MMHKGRMTAAATLVCVLGCWAALQAAEDANYSWQQTHAKVLPTGDLEWAPRPFVFRKGASVRYIDFAQGDDNSAGASKATAWKHHPWDANAAGKAKAATGIHTYVFKGGVAYYGKLLANKRGEQSGKPGNPIRLTRDPNWGRGDAMLYGSDPITGGWKQCQVTDGHKLMPEKDKVWYIDLGKRDVPIRAVWETRNGKSVRIHLARFPNWKVSNPIDPQKDWAEITRIIRTKKGDDNTLFDGKKDPKEQAGQYWLCDDKNLTNPDPEFYKGARLWGEWWGNMATPHISPNVVSKYNAKFKGINAFPCGYPAGGRTGNRFFLEGVPQFLDDNVSGEYYYAKTGPEAGRLYIRLPGDRDPNRSVIEVGARDYILDIRHQHDIEISGLKFSFVNPPRGVFDRKPHPSFVWPPIASVPSGVRIVGMSSNITVANCRFDHIVSAVTGFTRSSKNNEVYFQRNEAKDDDKMYEAPFGDVLDNITVSDCDITDVDHSTLAFRNGTVSGTPTPGDFVSTLKRLSILRNRITNVGTRQYGSKNSSISTIRITNSLQLEIAGNILDRCGGAGINIYGAKTAGDLRTYPLIRTLVHHNKVTNSLLSTNDYGGIEIWQGGPAYVYNNVCGNALGRRNYSWFDGGARKKKGWNWINWGHAYYCDGQYRSFTFNNIGWGIQSKLAESWGTTGTGDYDGTFLNMSMFCDVLGFQNHRFNNTAYKFAVGYHQAGKINSRNSLLGNVFADIGGQYSRASSDVGGAPGEITAKKKELSTHAQAGNVLNGLETDCWPALVGRKQWTGKPTVTLKDLQEKMAHFNLRKGGFGAMSKAMPLRDPEGRDFRLTDGSIAKNSGVKFFVPWSLYATVGEWNFAASAYDPGTVIGENFYFTDEYISRSMYNQVPWNDLKATGVTAGSYVAGALEDWTESALRFDGRTTFCTLSDKDMKADYPRTLAFVEKKDANGNVRTKMEKGKFTYPGGKRRTLDMDTNNFLIEVYLRTTSAGCVIASKMGMAAGYMLDLDDAGKPRLTVKADARAATHVRVGAKAVNDGKWHHVVAEVDRASEEGFITIYIDGKRAQLSMGGFRGAKMPKHMSFANTADFLVGKGPSGKLFAGDIDYLRVCRGTLKDAETTIEELHAWQFNGPHLKDFTGRKPQDGKRDAGALEMR